MGTEIETPEGRKLNVAFARPQDVDLAIPAAPQRLGAIMDHYPAPWERAGNCCYFEPGGQHQGQPYGLLARGSAIISTYPATWPALRVADGAASITEAGDVRPGDALAVAAGPMLVRNGQVVDVAAEIRRLGYTGFADGVRKPQAAVGVRADGLVVHAATESMTITELARAMQGLGCVMAMKLDSGGSVVVREKAKGIVAGYDLRLFPAALVFQRLAPVPADVQTKPATPAATEPVPTGPLGSSADPLNDVQLTPHFNLQEFECHDGSRSVKVDRRLVTLLEALRVRLGRPVQITSGYRTPAYDAQVGTSSHPGQGPHTTGTAADVVVPAFQGKPPLTPDEIAAAAEAVGIPGIGKYPTKGFCHLDLTPRHFVG